MRMRVLREKLRVEIENETRVFLESLNFEIEMRVSQKSASGIIYHDVHHMIKFIIIIVLQILCLVVAFNPVV